MLSPYNQEHLQTFQAARSVLDRMPEHETASLRMKIQPYVDFRKEVASFQQAVFSDVCTLKCYLDGTSACCAREGIMAFFADVVVNTLLSSAEEIHALEQNLRCTLEGSRCVYLSEDGCLWHLKPIVCEMFLCDHAVAAKLESDDSLRREWEIFQKREREFTWPDRPVLFDDLETFFLERGCESPLMYYHRSPGLLRVKAGWKA